MAPTGTTPQGPRSQPAEWWSRGPTESTTRRVSGAVRREGSAYCYRFRGRVGGAADGGLPGDADRVAELVGVAGSHIPLPLERRLYPKPLTNATERQQNSSGCLRPLNLCRSRASRGLGSQIGLRGAVARLRENEWHVGGWALVRHARGMGYSAGDPERRSRVAVGLPNRLVCRRGPRCAGGTTQLDASAGSRCITGEGWCRTRCGRGGRCGEPAVGPTGGSHRRGG